MNGYWRRETVSVAEAMEMARELWSLCHGDIRELDRYWARGGNAMMALEGMPGARVAVCFSPWLHRSAVTVERRGLKESMAYGPLGGRLGEFGPWRYNPSRREETEDLRAACRTALEAQAGACGIVKEEKRWKLDCMRLWRWRRA